MILLQPYLNDSLQLLDFCRKHVESNQQIHSLTLQLISEKGYYEAQYSEVSYPELMTHFREYASEVKSVYVTNFSDDATLNHKAKNFLIREYCTASSE